MHLFFVCLFGELLEFIRYERMKMLGLLHVRLKCTISNLLSFESYAGIPLLNYIIKLKTASIVKTLLKQSLRIMEVLNQVKKPHDFAARF